MLVDKLNYFKNAYIGVFISTNNRFTFVPIDSEEKLVNKCKEILKTEVIKITISYNSVLIGIYTSSNSNGIIIPGDSTNEEIESLKRIGLNVYALDDPHTAMGNLICTNDHAALVNKSIIKNKKEIEDCLDVEIIETDILPGANMVVTDKGLILNPELEEHLKEFEGIFKVKGNVGTANFGVPYLGICMIANKNGVLVGEETSGYEINRIEDALGVLG